ncbi:MAG: HEAT repeat domain-containing protein, partial [Parachlamydiaceae bacterium]|nr:HEAT repeat domain-containing protein [Parachlamydiaceae bacterium]
MKRWIHLILHTSLVTCTCGFAENSLLDIQTCPSLENTCPIPLSSAPSSTTTSIPNHILFLMHTGDTAKALTAYQEYTKQNGGHDFELIERIGLILLDQGFRSRDPETLLLTMFGTGISINEKALYILEEGLASDQAELQLIALNFLSKYQNDRADEVIHKAMASNYLIVRLEAVFNMARRKDPKATSQTEALMAKVSPEMWSVFPQIYAENGDDQSIKMLRKMLAHSNEEIRVESILGAAKNERDDLLPVIRRLATHHEPAQLEACAAALGILRDEMSAPRLLQLSKSSNATVKLAAFQALYILGRKEVRKEIEALAKNKDLFAITLLADMPGSEELLASLLKNSSPQVMANAALSLLELGDPRCLPLLAEILMKDARDLSILKMSSPGKSLSTWKIVPSSQQNFKDNQAVLEMSLHTREAIVVQSIELPEKYFIMLANAIFENQQNDLIPTLVEVLENHPTPEVIALLKKQQQKAGAPLIRNYCNLALYKLKEAGPYADNLR